MPGQTLPCVKQSPRATSPSPLVKPVNCGMQTCNAPRLDRAVFSGKSPPTPSQALSVPESTVCVSAPALNLPFGAPEPQWFPHLWGLSICTYLAMAAVA